MRTNVCAAPPPLTQRTSDVLFNVTVVGVGPPLNVQRNIQQWLESSTRAWVLAGSRSKPGPWRGLPRGVIGAAVPLGRMGTSPTRSLIMSSFGAVAALWGTPP
ncbi:hypothetical protein VTO73DRAFT_12828 [Trametes versicolor]